ncbi:hypothetical protein M231_06094 [Tremella mesenterica]|uniref:Uncharacterized protein n=1 Tax=Tremella mesenterica TaxID=5217 RepID=A0A4Q1BGF6_TREME|nr:hypothetical protein M231_06094 [Tremella mesenterica]
MPAISFLPFLQSVPLTTRLLVITQISLSLLVMLYRLMVQGSDMPWLVLSPGKSWLYPWTLVTAGWVENNLVELAFSALSLGFASRYLERVWGPRELVRFCLVVVIGGNVIAFGFGWLVFLVIGQEDAIYGPPFHGLSGLQAGFLVAFTQLIPEHQLQMFGVIKMRVKSLPGVYLLISNVLVILLGPSPYILIQFGFFVAWVYLRFFKLSEDGQFRGDRSETFAFQYWFPPIIRPYISIAANKVFSLAVKLHLTQAWDEPSLGTYQSLPGPGGARAEAERRRALALKALDARMASPAVPSPTPPPATTVPAAVVKVEGE